MIKNLSRKILLIVIGVTYLAATIPDISYIVFEDKFAQFYSIPVYRLPEFVIGICCFEISKKFARKSYDSYIILLFVVLLIYLSKHNAHIYITHNWIVVPVFSCIIIALAQSKGYICSLLSSKFFVWLGKISYCFYSFQALILMLFTQYRSSIAGLTLLEFIIIVGLLIIISAFGYHCIEKPLRRKINEISIK